MLTRKHKISLLTFWLGAISLLWMLRSRRPCHPILYSGGKFRPVLSFILTLLPLCSLPAQCQTSSPTNVAPLFTVGTGKLRNDSSNLPYILTGEPTVKVGTDTLNILGLSKVTKRGKLHHFYHYALEGKPYELVLSYRVKGIKPVATAKYEDLNPRKSEFQAWANRWQSTFGIGSSVSSSASSGVLMGILTKIHR